MMYTLSKPLFILIISLGLSSICQPAMASTLIEQSYRYDQIESLLLELKLVNTDANLYTIAILAGDDQSAVIDNPLNQGLTEKDPFDVDGGFQDDFFNDLGFNDGILDEPIDQVSFIPDQSSRQYLLLRRTDDTDLDIPSIRRRLARLEFFLSRLQKQRMVAADDLPPIQQQLRQSLLLRNSIQVERYLAHLALYATVDDLTGKCLHLSRARDVDDYFISLTDGFEVRPEWEPLKQSYATYATKMRTVLEEALVCRAVPIPTTLAVAQNIKDIVSQVIKQRIDAEVGRMSELFTSNLSLFESEVDRLRHISIRSEAIRNLARELQDVKANLDLVQSDALMLSHGDKAILPPIESQAKQGFPELSQVVAGPKLQAYQEAFAKKKAAISSFLAQMANRSASIQVGFPAAKVCRTLHDRWDQMVSGRLQDKAKLQADFEQQFRGCLQVLSDYVSASTKAGSESSLTERFRLRFAEEFNDLVRAMKIGSQ